MLIIVGAILIAAFIIWICSLPFAVAKEIREDRQLRELKRQTLYMQQMMLPPEARAQVQPQPAAGGISVRAAWLILFLICVLMALSYCGQ